MNSMDKRVEAACRTLFSDWDTEWMSSPTKPILRENVRKAIIAADAVLKQHNSNAGKFHGSHNGFDIHIVDDCGDGFYIMITDDAGPAIYNDWWKGGKLMVDARDYSIQIIDNYHAVLAESEGE